MNPFHERLARVGLAAGNRFGFALAGGYAMHANGMLDRPSEDVDLFTELRFAAQFDTAVAAIVEAYEADGLTVSIEVQAGTFARLYVSGGRDGSKVELSADSRANQPVYLSIGPVLHPDDAVTNKVLALFGRWKARDFIDVDAAICSGRYSRADLLALAAKADLGFDRSAFAWSLRQADALNDGQFAPYNVRGRDLDNMRARFADWRQELIG